MKSPSLKLQLGFVAGLPVREFLSKLLIDESFW
jgi:hypothetical protein